MLRAYARDALSCGALSPDLLETPIAAAIGRCCVATGQSLNAGSGSPAGTKIKAGPLLHQRFPVGRGPSSKTRPW